MAGSERNEDREENEPRGAWDGMSFPPEGVQMLMQAAGYLGHDVRLFHTAVPVGDHTLCASGQMGAGVGHHPITTLL
jgi:hypothetical protein